jgi:hypothetical protein
MAVANLQCAANPMARCDTAIISHWHKCHLDQGHNLSWNAGWNYSQYGERVVAGPAAPRYFHANNATLSLHHSF